MTPNQPSGMTPKNPEPRPSMFTRLFWLRWQRIQRPAPATPYSPGLSALVDPFLATEAVSEANRPGAVAQAQRTRQLMDRVCAVNNANVTRNYGTHTEDLSKPQQPPPLTAEDLADAKKLLDVLVVGKPGASYSWD